MVQVVLGVQGASLDQSDIVYLNEFGRNVEYDKDFEESKDNDVSCQIV